VPFLENNSSRPSRSRAVDRPVAPAAGARAGDDSFDELERISTQTLMDILEVPQRRRTAGTYRHLATLTAELGWTAVRVRDMTRGGYKEQVRGYVRTAPSHRQSNC
jgi:hypothetical protein